MDPKNIDQRRDARDKRDKPDDTERRPSDQFDDEDDDYDGNDHAQPEGGGSDTDETDEDDEDNLDNAGGGDLDEGMEKSMSSNDPSAVAITEDALYDRIGRAVALAIAPMQKSISDLQTQLAGASTRIEEMTKAIDDNMAARYDQTEALKALENAVGLIPESHEMLKSIQGGFKLDELSAAPMNNELPEGTTAAEILEKSTVGAAQLTPSAGPVPDVEKARGLIDESRTLVERHGSLGFVPEVEVVMSGIVDGSLTTGQVEALEKSLAYTSKKLGG